jgi:hypothetical protein
MYNKYATKYPRIVNISKTLLLHDNARPHTAQLTKDLVKSLKVDVLPHPCTSALYYKVMGDKLKLAAEAKCTIDDLVPAGKLVKERSVSKVYKY